MLLLVNKVIQTEMNNGLFGKTMEIYTSLPIWVMIAIPLIISIAGVLAWRRITSPKPTNRSKKAMRNNQTTANWLSVSTKAKVVGGLGVLILSVASYGYMTREKKISIQFVEATEANNGEKSVNVNALVDVMKIVIANSKNFEIVSSNGEYNIKVTVGGNTPRVMIHKTGTDNLFGGGVIDLPYEKDGNMSMLGKQLAEDSMEVISKKLGLKYYPSGGVKLPIQKKEVVAEEDSSTNSSAIGQKIHKGENNKKPKGTKQ